jgi:phenylpropionate dioxygenase-like ring-hydroxylating dioxygenase large terminal subunit
MAIVSKDGSTIRRSAFNSEEIFADEMARVFQHTWQFVAHDSEIAHHGDYVQRTLGSDTVIVSRSEDGSVHVLQNACRHRGAQLCRADSGNTSHFRCSYHGWTFANDGRLRGIPNAKELYAANKLDRSQYGLRAARVQSIYGLIFATWDHDGPSLEEALGNAVWYLQAVFDKDLEVMGSPTRIMGKHNWKAGAENFTPDTYHAFVTHKVVVDLGIIVSADVAIAESVANGAGNFRPEAMNEERNSTQVILDNGHSLMCYGGLTFDRPAFVGYEGHLWDDFAKRLSPEQLDFQNGQIAGVGTIFPNFSWTEQFVSNVGTNRQGVKFINVRLWRPVSATETEMHSWVLVPKAASDDWKFDSQRGFLRCLGVAGIYEVDDLQNWTGMSQVGRGAVAQDTPNNMSAVVSQRSKTIKWEGKVYTANLDDIGFRNFYQEWAKRMGYEGNDLDASLIPDEIADQGRG